MDRLDDPVVWIDGRLGPASQTQVSPFDHALLTGDGVFETLKVVGGRPFALTRHLERLRRSAGPMDLEPAADADLRDAVAAVIEGNAVEHGRVRITVTGGPSPLASNRGGPPTTIVAAASADPRPATTPVVVAPWPRNERAATAGLKTVSYAENVIALRYALDRGASEAIFGNTSGRLCEGTGSNIFVVVDDTLVTPPLSSGCLAGITRDLLVERGVADEVDLPLSALDDVREAFLTSSTRDVQPITAIDGRALDPAPGPLSAAAAERFREIEAESFDP